MTTPNSYAAARREQKALKLARLLRDSGASVESVEKLTDRGRREIERLAEVNSPSSDETWALVVEMLSRMRAAATPPADVYSGLPGDSL